jgi:signal transduction histidine kinase
VIPFTEIDRLFEPFQRLSGYRIHHDHGHGLGLSIVRAIAIAHGATITTEPSPHGGVAIEVAFPQPADQDAPRATETSAAVTLR